jgi:hypothetical protein
MTPEERSETMAVLKQAIFIANQHGHEIMNECSPDVAVTSAAIMLSTFCSAAGMTMHEAVGLFMATHKQTENMVKERQQ